MSKLNLVNPLNPNQIIKTEDISNSVNNAVDNNINTNVVQNNEMNQTNMVQNNFNNQVFQPNTIENNSVDNQSTNNIDSTNNQQQIDNNDSNKKKLNIILIIVAVVVVLGLIIGYFLFVRLNNSNNDVPKEPNNSENINEGTNNEESNKLSINNIVESFNKNVAIFPLESGSTVKAEVDGESIKVSVIYPDSVLYFYFSINNRDLSSTILKEDALAFKTTAYIISSISDYYGNDFNATYNYINNNKDSLSNIKTIAVTELDKLYIISLNIDNPVVAQ